MSQEKPTTVAGVLSLYIEQENLNRTEGSEGVKNLCQICQSLGYEDKMYFGQLSNGCCIGDLIEFLEDNPGAIGAIVEWIGLQKQQEWIDSVVEYLDDPDDEQELEVTEV